ncbi:hypothetical protein FACS18949_12950 [Clostridia bacterium]|nr:hypothetical protein FACS18949_12950 [Clostridia bacterium]
MSDIVSKASEDSDKEYIHEHCVNLLRLDNGKYYGADYSGKLSDIAVQCK